MLVVVLVVFALYDRLLGLSTMTGESAQRTGSRRVPGPMHRVGRRACSARSARVSDRLIALCAAQPPARARAGALAAACAAPCWLMLLFLSVPALLMIPLSFGEVGA